MENIKTIGELRKKIEEEGEFKVGVIKVSYDVGGDIDIYFKDRLIQWILADVSGDTLLTDLNDSDYSVSTDWDDIDEIKKKNRTLEKRNEELEKIISTEKLALGKVEAYEKLLIGRAITISA